MSEDLDLINYKKAVEVSQKSGDPQCKVGALIFHEFQDNVIPKLLKDQPVASGYNTLSLGLHFLLEHLSEDSIVHIDSIKRKIWADQDLKSVFVVHAEIQCLKEYDVVDCFLNNEGGVMYVTKPPCRNCALEIVKRKKIKRIVIPKLNEESKWFKSQTQGLEIFKENGLQVDYIEV